MFFHKQLFAYAILLILRKFSRFCFILFVVYFVFRIPELRLSPVFNKTNPDLENKIDKEITDKKPLFEPCDSIIVNDTNNNSNTSDKIYHNGLSVLSQISDTSDDTQVS